MKGQYRRAFTDFTILLTPGILLLLKSTFSKLNYKSNLCLFVPKKNHFLSRYNKDKYIFVNWSLKIFWTPQDEHSTKRSVITTLINSGSFLLSLLRTEGFPGHKAASANKVQTWANENGWSSFPKCHHFFWVSSPTDDTTMIKKHWLYI